MKRALVYGAALSASLLTTSCDSTIWLDTTLPSLTGVYLSGACQTGPNELDVSMVLVNSGQNTSLNILPTTRVAKVKSKTVFELMKSKPSDFNSASFDFNKSDYMTNLEMLQQLEPSDGVAFIEGEDGSDESGRPQPLSVETINLEYRWASKVLDQLQLEKSEEIRSVSGDPTVLAVRASNELAGVYKERVPLLILLLDQSRSILGLGRSLPEDDDFQMYATDSGSERLTFFSSLIKNLDDRFEVSMMWFSETLSTYNSDISNVYRPVTKENRQFLYDEINNLNMSGSFKSRTPLRQALTDAKSLIENLDNDQYDPVVVVFTDGTENGDNSSESALSHEELSQFFVERHVPVHTIQLRAKINPGRDPAEEEMRPVPLWEMSELACQTGGEFFYLENASQFTYNDALEPILRNRLTGRWSLKVNSGEFSGAVNELGTSGVKMSSSVEVTLAKQGKVYESRVFEQVDDDGRPIKVDKRAWVHLTE